MARKSKSNDCWEEFHARFPYRLHRALSQVERQGKTHIVSWLPCGSMFKVHDIEAFAREVMPSIGRFTRYKSFLRQLCIYKFDRISSGSLKGAFNHPYFRRDHASLCRAVLRGEMYAHPDRCVEHIKGNQFAAPSPESTRITKGAVSSHIRQELNSISAGSRLSMDEVDMEQSGDQMHNAAADLPRSEGVDCLSRVDLECYRPRYPLKVSCSSLPLCPESSALSFHPSPNLDIGGPSSRKGSNRKEDPILRCEVAAAMTTQLVGGTTRRDQADKVISLEPSPPSPLCVIEATNELWPSSSLECMSPSELPATNEIVDEIIATFAGNSSPCSRLELRTPMLT